MSDALASTDFTPTPTGLDYSYLIDGSDTYFRICPIDEIVAMMEEDAYYDEPGRMTGAHLYLLLHGREPMSVRAEHTTYNRDTDYVYKVMRIYNQTGDLLSQHGYKIPV